MRYIVMLGGVLIALLGLGLLFALGIITQQPVSVNGTLIEPSEPVEPFYLMSGEGPIHTSEYEGKFIILVFGFTHCPDICPTTMSRVAQAVNLLEDRADPFQVMMVSLDPERDKPEQVWEYTQSFHHSFLGLTGTDEQIKDVTSRFGIHYERSQEESASGYLIDHTSTSIVLDRRGGIVLLWSFDLTPEQMVEDMEFLLKYR